MFAMAPLLLTEVGSMTGQLFDYCKMYLPGEKGEHYISCYHSLAIFELSTRPLITALILLFFNLPFTNSQIFTN
jgi:hypothetical protein